MSIKGPDEPHRQQIGGGGEPAQSWSTVVSPGPSPAVQVTMDQMTEQLQTVIDAAERAAAVIRHDAEEQARRHLADAQGKADRLTAERVRLIAQLTDDLLRHAGTVRDQSEHMVDSLELAIRSVTEKLDQENGQPSPPPASPQLEAPGEVVEPEVEVAVPMGFSQDALMEATRLAIAGADREAVAAMLRRDYGIADPAPVVDRVMGPSS